MHKTSHPVVLPQKSIRALLSKLGVATLSCFVPMECMNIVDDQVLESSLMLAGNTEMLQFDLANPTSIGNVMHLPPKSVSCDRSEGITHRDEIPTQLNQNPTYTQQYQQPYSQQPGAPQYWTISQGQTQQFEQPPMQPMEAIDQQQYHTMHQSVPLSMKQDATTGYSEQYSTAPYTATAPTVYTTTDAIPAKPYVFDNRPPAPLNAPEVIVNLLPQQQLQQQHSPSVVVHNVQQPYGSGALMGNNGYYPMSTVSPINCMGRGRRKRKHTTVRIGAPLRRGQDSAGLIVYRPQDSAGSWRKGSLNLQPRSSQNYQPRINTGRYKSYNTSRSSRRSSSRGRSY